MQVAFLWHMHQPDYRDRDRREILLPWVRLHALKDYYDMPARLERFEGIHQTFNLVPSLLEQLEAYGKEGWRETELELFLRPAALLTLQEKQAVSDSFFDASEERMIKPHPRYASLLREKRLRSFSDLVQRWSEQEWRDLQFWRQLSWVDPMIRDRDPALADLIRQGQNFTESQKDLLRERMQYWLRETIGVYARLQAKGTIEISLSPFYHPILPLLIDPSSVREAMPECPLPEPHSPHPEDARVQMELAIAFFEDRFGVKPRGVWPPEGAVSEETVSLMAELGIGWVASDEDILARSLGRPVRNPHGNRTIARDDLYRPYRTLGGKGPVILFRDHRLSDLIGFEFQRWPPEEAAHYLVQELLSIQSRWTGPEPPLVSIVLDGENCWEYYSDDGGPFLDALYGKILETPNLKSVTVSEALEGRTPLPVDRLAAGSWINGNFHIWMGEEADRRAWALVEEARRVLEEEERKGTVSEEDLCEARTEIYVAQGSDWYWWFGDTHNAANLTRFDEMFRQHLVRVYTLLRRRTPDSLLAPLEIPSTQDLNYPEPTLLAGPVIDGSVTHYYEWLSAARHDARYSGGAMRVAGESGIECLYYGGDESGFYLRADPSRPLLKKGTHCRWEILVTVPNRLLFRFYLTPQGYEIRKTRQIDKEVGRTSEGSEEVLDGTKARAVEGSVFEVMLTWDVLETGDEETLSFFVSILTGKGERETIPSLSSLCMTIPGRGRLGRPWFV